MKRAFAGYRIVDLSTVHSPFVEVRVNATENGDPRIDDVTWEFDVIMFFRARFISRPDLQVASSVFFRRRKGRLGEDEFKFALFDLRAMVHQMGAWMVHIYHVRRPLSGEMALFLRRANNEISLWRDRLSKEVEGDKDKAFEWIRDRLDGEIAV